jgi:hypothetical protein
MFECPHVGDERNFSLQNQTTHSILFTSRASPTSFCSPSPILFPPPLLLHFLPQITALGLSAPARFCSAAASHLQRHRPLPHASTTNLRPFTTHQASSSCVLLVGTFIVIMVVSWLGFLL